MLTWGDGVSDIDIDKLIEFHRSHGKLCTMTAVRPPARFGHMEMDGDAIVEFSEKPQTGEGWINGAFFVCEQAIFDYIDGDDALGARAARAPRQGRPADGVPARVVLAVHGHPARRKQLEALWDSGQAPWKVWS